MKAYLEEAVRRKIEQRRRWEERTVKKALAPWKWKALGIFPNPYLAKALGVNVSVEDHIQKDHSRKVIIRLNGKKIGQRTFR